MTARVTWLPTGHIAHGYRRVFALHEGAALRHVVVLAPMPYESVYGVLQLAKEGEGLKDPSLWWGLSIIARLAADGTLLQPSNPDIADDGYLQLRPPMLERGEFIPLSACREAIEREEFLLSRKER